MLNSEQREFAVEEVNRYADEANRADRRAFWDLIGVLGCAALVGVSSVLARGCDPQYVNLVDTGLKTIGVGGGIILSYRAVTNQGRSNVKEGNAEMVNTMIEINDREAPVEVRRRRR